MKCIRIEYVYEIMRTKYSSFQSYRNLIFVNSFFIENRIPIHFSSWCIHKVPPISFYLSIYISMYLSICRMKVTVSYSIICNLLAIYNFMACTSTINQICVCHNDYCSKLLRLPLFRHIIIGIWIYDRCFPFNSKKHDFVCHELIIPGQKPLAPPPPPPFASLVAPIIVE